MTFIASLQLLLSDARSPRLLDVHLTAFTDLAVSIDDVAAAPTVPFMVSVHSALLLRGVAPERVRDEVFGPDRPLVTA